MEGILTINALGAACSFERRPEYCRRIAIRTIVGLEEHHEKQYRFVVVTVPPPSKDEPLVSIVSALVQAKYSVCRTGVLSTCLTLEGGHPLAEQPNATANFDNQDLQLAKSCDTVHRI